jgi:DNA-binding response OmpR family regulator
MSGDDVCRTLKADLRFKRTRLIFLTAQDELAKEIKGLDAAAIDDITKPGNILQLRARLRNHLALVRCGS